MPGMGGPPGMPGGGGPPGMPKGPEPSIVVDMDNLNNGEANAIAVKATTDLKKLRIQMEEMQGNHDREAADGKRIRAEAASLRDRIEEQRATIKDREEQAQAHQRVADELRDELGQTRDELAGARGEMSKLAETVAEIGRAHV